MPRMTQFQFQDDASTIDTHNGKGETNTDTIKKFSYGIAENDQAVKANSNLSLKKQT